MIHSENEINHPATDDFMALLEEEMASVIVETPASYSIPLTLRQYQHAGTSHFNCDHEATKTGRAKCRRQRAKNA
jgi:hypothetical protein